MAGMAPVRPFTSDESEGGWYSVYADQQREIAADDARERARFAAQGTPPVETPAQTARKAGFPMTPIPGYYTPPPGAPQAAPPAPPPIPRSALAPGQLVPMKGPSAGTTELIPGATDWIRNLAADLLPSRPAGATGMPPPAPPSALSRVSGAPNPNFVGPPAPEPGFFSRFIRGLTPGPGAPSSGGVQG